MGTFTQPITLHSTNGNSEETLEALVDTGATFTAMPSAVLERLGIAPEYSVSLRLANGQLEQRQMAEVRAELAGDSRNILCVFGDAASPPIIGAHALEAFLLSVDPVEQRLVPVVGYWM